MAELDLTNAFNDCVDRITQGQSLEDCLRRYPQYASALRPMLEAGLLVQRIRVQSADVLAAQNRVRRRFEDALRAPQSNRTSPIRRFAFALAAIFIVGFISLGSLTAVSQNSLPGDSLYGVKIFSEGVQRSLFDNDSLESGFDQRRIQEIQQLLALGRPEEVAFSGAITTQNGTNWVIASLPITVSLDIQSRTTAHIGDQVNVTALTTELHTLTALSIQIDEAASSPIPTLPTNTLVPTVTILTQTPTPSASKTPTMPSLLATNTTQPSPSTIIRSATPMPPAPTTSPTRPSTVIPQITILTLTACAPTQPNGWVSYQIQSGDTLSALASKTSITLTELMTINCITDAGRIIVGETIYLPRTPSISVTATSSTSNQGSEGNNSNTSSPTDDHGGGSDSSHGGSGNGDSGKGGSDDGSSHS